MNYPSSFLSEGLFCSWSAWIFSRPTIYFNAQPLTPPYYTNVIWLSSNFHTSDVKSSPASTYSTKSPGIQSFCTRSFINLIPFCPGLSVRLRPFPLKMITRATISPNVYAKPIIDYVSPSVRFQNPERSYSLNPASYQFKYYSNKIKFTKSDKAISSTALLLGRSAWFPELP